MKAIQQNLTDWLRREAHTIAGQPFKMDNCSCVPVAPENQRDEALPVGFLVTRGADVAYVAAQTPDGERMMTAWEKQRFFETTVEKETLPAEYWYG